MKKIIITIVVISCFFSLIISSSAIDLALEDITDDKKTLLIDEYNLCITDEPVKDIDFSSFDVNSKGECLIGFVDYEGRGFNTKSVGKLSVYNSDGEFLYGYSFNTPGAIRVFWDDENICIFSIKDNNLIVVDSKGSVIKIASVKNTSENVSYKNNELQQKTKEINGFLYSAKTGNSLIDNYEDVFSGNYSSLIRTDKEGIEVLIYDNSSNSTFDLNYLPILISAGLFVVITVSIFVSVFLKTRKSSRK